MTKHISRDASISFNPKGLSGMRRLSDEEKRVVENELKTSGRL
jgi:hypothetical protein